MLLPRQISFGPPGHPSTASMSTSNAGSNRTQASDAQPGPQKNNRRILRFLWYSLGLLVLLLVLLPFCRTTGKEFSPIKFQTRSFVLYRIPGTQLQFLPTFFSDPASASNSTEILANLINLSQAEIWHTAGSNSYGGDSFPAQLLLEAIERKDSEFDCFWDVWSANHPNRAKILWPIIQSMAIANLYHEIPESLRLAEGFQGADAEFPKTLLSEIHHLLQKRQTLYPTSSVLPKDFDSRSEGIPEWTDVQKWMQENPIPN